MTRRVKCPRCGYIWNTRSTKEYVTCPNCQRKIKPLDLDKNSRDRETLEKLKSEIIECIKRNNALRIIDENEPCIKLSSGTLSPYYIDLRRVLFRDVTCLRKIAEAVILKVKSENIPVDVVACKALGAVPLAVTLSLLMTKPLIVVREKEKTHGLGGKVVGPVEELRGKRVLVVDDVATTGSSLLEVIDVVERHGGTVSKVIVIVDRMEGAAERLKKRGHVLQSLLTRLDLGISDELLNRLAARCVERTH